MKNALVLSYKVLFGRNHFEQSEPLYKPLYVRDGPNGLPAVRFSHSKHFIRSGMSVSSNFSVFVVAMPTATIGNIYNPINNTVVEGNNSDQRYIFSPVSFLSSGNATMGLSIGTNAIQVFERAGGYVPALGLYEYEIGAKPSVISINYIDNQPFIYFNGSLVGSSLVSSHNSYLSQRLGSNVDQFPGFEGDVSEVIVFERSLNLDEIEAIHSYLMDKWGISN